MAADSTHGRGRLLLLLVAIAGFNARDASAFFQIAPPCSRRIVAARPGPLMMQMATTTATGSTSSISCPRRSLHTRRLLSRRPSHGHGGATEGGGDVALLREPEEMYESAVELGTEKAQSPIFRTFVLAIQAGLQVGIGAAMAVATLAGLPGLSTSNPALAKLVYGVVGLPCGLLMTAATGTMLFTGNTCLVGVAWMERKVTGKQLLTNWVVSYLGNLVGAAALAALCTYAGVFSGAVPAINTVAAYKGGLPAGVAFARGVLCNWLVTTAVWIAQGCRDLASKSAIILLVITIFAALGFEHSVANMFLGPFAALNGGQPFKAFLLQNLVPVTLGNIVAGFFVVAGTYFLSYGSFAKKRRPGGESASASNM